MYFDAHTHLNSENLYKNRQDHLKKFIKGWGIWLVNIGVNQEYNLRGIEICKELQANDTTPKIGNTDRSGKYFKGTYDKDIVEEDKKHNTAQVYCTIWLHPCEITEGNITDFNIHLKIKEMSLLYTPYKEFIVWIGECGIDTNQPGTESTLLVQKELFIQQCDLARRRGLPIIIHSRANREATHEILKEFTDLRIYFHCRSYTTEEIKIIKKTYPDFYVGFTWNITYPKAIDIRKSLRYLAHDNEEYPDHIISWIIDTTYKTKKQHIEHLLIETDAPYLAPQSHRGETNTPAFIKDTYKYISGLLGQDIAKNVIKNTKKCYNIEW